MIGLIMHFRSLLLSGLILDSEKRRSEENKIIYNALFQIPVSHHLYCKTNYIT